MLGACSPSNYYNTYMTLMALLHPEHIEADIIKILLGSENRMRAATDIHKIIFTKYDLNVTKQGQQLILKTIVKMSSRNQVSIHKVNNITYLRLDVSE